MADNFMRIRSGINFGSLASAPSNPVNGDVYYDTGLVKFRAYEGGSWKDLIATGGGGSTTLTGTAGETLAANDLVYLSIGAGDGGRTAGRFYKVDATNDNRVNYIGWVSVGGAGGASITVTLAGEMTGLTGLSQGLPVFASVTTPGSYQSTQPNVAGQWIIPVGIATSASKVAINAAGAATAVKISSGGIGAFINTNAQTANYAALVTDDAIFMDATSGNKTITLPAASGNAGKILHIKKVDATAFTVTIDGNGSEVIDGNLTLILSALNQSVTIVCNGTGWYVI